MRTKSWQSPTRGLRLVGEDESGSASTTFGPVRAGLTTTHKIQSHQLSVSLNSLERKVEDLTSRYLEVSSTLTSVMEDLVRLGLIGNGSSIIDEEDSEE